MAKTAPKTLEESLALIAEMEKTISALETENLELGETVEKLKAAKPLPVTAREKLIREKMAAGLSREIAEESVTFQEQNDKLSK